MCRTDHIEGKPLVQPNSTVSLTQGHCIAGSLDSCSMRPSNASISQFLTLLPYSMTVLTYCRYSMIRASGLTPSRHICKPVNASLRCTRAHKHKTSGRESKSGSRRASPALLSALPTSGQAVSGCCRGCDGIHEHLHDSGLRQS